MYKSFVVFPLVPFLTVTAANNVPICEGAYEHDLRAQQSINQTKHIKVFFF